MADGPLSTAADSADSTAADFEPVDRADWLAAVADVLQGRSFDEALVSRTRDGLEIQPLYTADAAAADLADLADPDAFAVPADAERIRDGWDIRQRHHVGDAAAANAAILDDLANGVTSIELAPAAWAAGSALWDCDLGALLDGVDLAETRVALAPHGSLEAARSLADLLASQATRLAQSGELPSPTTPIEPPQPARAAKPGAWLGLDPIGHAASAGDMPGQGGPAEDGGPAGGSAALAEAAALAVEQLRRFGVVRAFTVDGVRYANAGATPAQELGWMLATGAACLRALEQAGADLAEAASAIGLRVSAGCDQFATTAATRALRGAWARVLDACGVARPQQSIRIHAVACEAVFGRRDPWANMLRSTSAVLGAVIGGADAITVLPHDVLARQSARRGGAGPGDAFSRRAARNVQLLLAEESGIARLADPAAGSWFVESLTARLAEAAWTVFGQVEAAGGMEAAVRSGSVAVAAGQAADERLEALATRRQILTGVTDYPELTGFSAEPSPSGAHVGEPAETEQPPGLPLRRLAAPFEALQDAAERAQQRPMVFAAALGDLATHTPRSAWTANLLAVGGVELVGADGDGSFSPLEAAASFAESGCEAAVICSSDSFYAQRGAATATALKEAGAQFVALAGAPHTLGETSEALAAAGVDEYWHAGVDVLAVLRRLHDLLGVAGPAADRGVVIGEAVSQEEATP